MKTIVTTICILFFWANTIFAQEIAFVKDGSVQISSIEVSNNKIPNQFAVPIDFQLNYYEFGTWEKVGALMIWNTKILVPKDYYSINLGLSEFSLPENTKFWISTDSSFKNIEPFLASDNDDHNTFWTPIFEGNEIYLRLQVPFKQIKNLKLKIDKINVATQSLFKINDCGVDAVCGVNDGLEEIEAYRDEIRAAGLVTVNGISVCSGFLVNNSNFDQTPYFLTAKHCQINQQNEASVVVYWNYQRKKCGSGEQVAIQEFNSGAKLRAINIPTDILLLELDDMVSSEVNPYFVGWNNDCFDVGQTAAIFFPDGHPKEVAIDFNPPITSMHFNKEFDKNGNHLLVESWDIGVTRNGASGCGLFDESGRVIGVLHGGTANCEQTGSDWFGQVKAAWEKDDNPNGQLKYWLDPAGTNDVSLQGYDPTIQGDLQIEVSVLKQNTCFSGVDGIVEVLGKAGNPPYTYSVNDKQFDSQNVFRDLEPGIYNFAVKDSLGDIVHGDLELTSPDSLFFEYVIDGLQVFLNGVGGEAPYFFSKDKLTFFSTQMLSFEEFGTHSVFIMDKNGCIYEEQINLEYTDMHCNIEISQEVKCHDEMTGVIESKVEGGYGDFLYSLDNVNFSSQSMFSNLFSGWYQMWIKDETNKICTTDSIILKNPTQIEIEAFDIEENTILVKCFGGTGELAVQVDGKFLDSNEFTISESRNYQISIIDENKCRLDTTIFLQPVSAFSVLGNSDFKYKIIDDFCELEFTSNLNQKMLEIFDLNGELIFFKVFKNYSKKERVDLKSLNTGLYFIVVRIGEKIFEEKFIYLK